MEIIVGILEKIKEFGVAEMFLSFATAYFLLYAVTRFTKGELSVIRLIVASIVCALSEVIGGMLTGVYALVFLFSTSMLALLLIKSEYGIKEFISVTTVYCALRVALELINAGAYALIYDKMLSSYVTTASLFVIFVAVNALNSLARSKFRPSDIVGIEASFCGKTLKLKGFRDTGNALYEGGKPVSVISKKVAERLGVVATGEIAVNTVAGIKLLPSANIGIRLYSDKNRRKEYITKVVISDKMVSRGYDMILHKDTEVL